MLPCDELIERLEDAIAGTLPPPLAEHVRACPQCQQEVARARGGSPAAAVLPAIRAPRNLVARVKSMPRLAPECETTMELICTTLDGELDAAARGRLLDHLHRCPRCQAAWEAFATLREVGSHIRAPHRLRAAVAVPPRHRLALRHRRPAFDMRLATAAAYLLAATTIVLVSNPATVARASSTTMERAGIYARAAVENRFGAYSHRVQATVLAGAGWLRQHGSEALARGRELLGLHRENPNTDKPVERSGQGGKQP